MSMLAMPPSPPHGFMRGNYYRDLQHSPEYIRPDPAAKAVALPSIRQAFPELQLSTFPSDRSPRQSLSTTSPNPSTSGFLTSPEYVLTPNSRKRRRGSSPADSSEHGRPRQAPRLLLSPKYSARPVSPPPSMPPSSTWSTSSRQEPPSPHSSLSGQPGRAEHSEQRPLLPPMAGSVERMRPLMSEHENVSHHASDPEHAAPASAYPFGHQYLSRQPSFSEGSSRPHDRSPFTNGHYGSSYQHEIARFGDGHGSNGEKTSSARKRRGNLPKETTDKLRSWFVAHLQHPYPTEDEKQDLMRQTGLQMNQISNWFINARRRQLPAMINSARAEVDAMSAQKPDRKLSDVGPGARYNQGKLDHRGLLLSDMEDAIYEDDIRQGRMKRGSV